MDGELPLIPEKFAAHRSRNNQILLAALAQIQPQVDDAIAKYGRERIAIVLGTSTSGLHEGDTHVNLCTNGQPSTTWHYAQQELGDPSRFLSHWLALDGPAYTLSTACSSSARAIISGRRLIEAGLVDAAIVGGADTLSRMPINGFTASNRCRQPYVSRSVVTAQVSPLAKARADVINPRTAAHRIAGRW